MENAWRRAWLKECVRSSVVLLVLFCACGKTGFEQDRCGGVSCSDHGRCVTADDQPACLCDSGYHGWNRIHCVADSSLCDGIDCSGRGRCNVSPEGMAVCECDAGFENLGRLACVPAQNGKCLRDGDCDDDNPCTDDLCDAAGDCRHSFNDAPCDDGVFCDGEEQCDGGGRCVSSGNPCAEVECGHCNELSLNCVDPAQTACDDGNPCTDNRCDGFGRCLLAGLLADFSPCVSEGDPPDGQSLCSGGVCVRPGCGDESCNVPGLSFPLPDTNQRGCFDAGAQLPVCPGRAFDPSCGSTAFCGEDAQVGWDTANDESLRFTRENSVVDQPVVRDNIAGLMWQGCAAGLSGQNCDAGGGVLATFSWSEAFSYCNDLSWGGYGDWRLPDEYELMSIVDYGRASPGIDPAAFPATPGGCSPFWVSSSMSDVSNAWTVDKGIVTYFLKTSEWFVRCVRRELAVALLPTRYERSEPKPGEVVVEDARTGLTWQGCAAGFSGASCTTGSGQVMTWEAALAYCQDLDWGGYIDWYLPNVKELSSIVSRTRSNPAIDLDAFPGTPAVLFMSSTTNLNNMLDAFWVAFDVGRVDACGKTQSYWVRCAR